MKILAACIMLVLTSCATYGYYITETKITFKGSKVYMQESGKTKPLRDTTITVNLITKRRLK